MDTQPTFDSGDPFAGILTDIAKAVGERPEETPHQQTVRIRTVTRMIMEFAPADLIEVMLAGHCVIFHELILDSLGASARDEEDKKRRASHGGIVAMDRAFGNNLTRLERYRSRKADAATVAKPAPVLAETAIADRVRRHQAASPTPARTVSSFHEPMAAVRGDAATAGIPQSVPSTAMPAGGDARDVTSAVAAPAPETIPPAGAAPDEVEPAAVMPVLNRQARRALHRQVSRLVGAAIDSTATPRPAGKGVTPTRNAQATTISATSAG